MGRASALRARGWQTACSLHLWPGGPPREGDGRAHSCADDSGLGVAGLPSCTRRLAMAVFCLGPEWPRRGA
eukprot:4759846-Alexandrium_andersonii.AAC.1